MEIVAIKEVVLIGILAIFHNIQIINQLELKPI